MSKIRNESSGGRVEYRCFGRALKPFGAGPTVSERRCWWSFCWEQSVYSRHWNPLRLWSTFPGEVVRSLDSEVVLGQTWVNHWLFPMYILYMFRNGSRPGFVPVFALIYETEKQTKNTKIKRLKRRKTHMELWIGSIRRLGRDWTHGFDIWAHLIQVFIRC